MKKQKDLSRRPAATVLTTRLHSHQLQLDALDGHVRVLHHQLSGQRLADHAVGGV